MATVTLNIPTEKIQSFLAMLVQSGFEKPVNNFLKNRNGHPMALLAKQDRHNMHPYYDWEFYNNELEYE